MISSYDVYITRFGRNPPDVYNGNLTEVLTPPHPTDIAQGLILMSSNRWND